MRAVGLAAEAILIAFQLLPTKIAAGEIANLRRALPADLRAIWCLSSAAP